MSPTRLPLGIELLIAHLGLVKRLERYDACGYILDAADSMIVYLRSLDYNPEGWKRIPAEHNWGTALVLRTTDPDTKGLLEVLTALGKPSTMSHVADGVGGVSIENLSDALPTGGHAVWMIELPTIRYYNGCVPLPCEVGNHELYVIVVHDDQIDGS